MFSVLVATRMVINVARYPLSNVITRSFIACPRVAYVKSKTASPEPTTQPSETPTAAPAKGGRKPKEPKLEPTSKPNPKKVAIPENLKPPKRPSSPYLLFVRDYLQKNPRSSDKEPPQVKFKECGAEWRALPDAEKERYTQAYHREFVEFAKKREAWFKTIDPAMLKAINKSRKASGKPVLRDGDKPKSDKPLTPFFRFLKQLRAESVDNHGTPMLEFSSQAGEKWRSLSEKEKQPYRDTYEREMSEWRARHAPDQA